MISVESSGRACWSVSLAECSRSPAPIHIRAFGETMASQEIPSFLISTKEHRETFHPSNARKTERKLTEISSPRWLRIKGTDTDSLRGYRLESGETGVRVADGSAEDGQSGHAERHQAAYTVAVAWWYRNKTAPVTSGGFDLKRSGRTKHQDSTSFLNQHASSFGRWRVGSSTALPTIPAE